MSLLFEDFVLDPARREFTRRGAEVTLEPQVFDLLVYLVRQREHVVDKDELIHHVWKGRVVSDSTIESRLCVLRKALHDDGRSQRLIRTYARKGVRFVGEVQVQARPSVVVIPFANLSGDPAQDGLAEGIAADTLALLTHNRTLYVLACHMHGMPFGADPVGAAAALGADYAVTGSLYCAAGRLRVAFQLVDARCGHALWAEHYDRQIDDVFSAQDDIAQHIVGCLGPEIDRCTGH